MKSESDRCEPTTHPWPSNVCQYCQRSCVEKSAHRPLEVSSYTMRLIGKSGERVTLGGSPGSDGLVDETRLKSILDHLAERGATNLHGVVSIEGILLTNNYDRIASDPNVYLVDVSGTFARNEINQDSSLRGQSQRFVVPPAFWYLEDLGLAK